MENQKKCETCPSEDLLDRNCAAMIYNGYCELYSSFMETSEIRTFPKTSLERRVRSIKTVVDLEADEQYL
ncbi:hypothetical protein KC950_02345 [Candidatus Saccharibacteria bacterium]|nr:hypothetical protein [Candidatus Saccharibacteria bacterium]